MCDNLYESFRVSLSVCCACLLSCIRVFMCVVIYFYYCTVLPGILSRRFWIYSPLCALVSSITVFQISILSLGYRFTKQRTAKLSCFFNLFFPNVWDLSDTWFLMLVGANRILMPIFGPKRFENEKWLKIRNFIVCTVQILWSGRFNPKYCNG